MFHIVCCNRLGRPQNVPFIYRMLKWLWSGDAADPTGPSVHAWCELQAFTNAWSLPEQRTQALVERTPSGRKSNCRFDVFDIKRRVLFSPWNGACGTCIWRKWNELEAHWAGASVSPSLYVRKHLSAPQLFSAFMITSTVIINHNNMQN